MRKDANGLCKLRLILPILHIFILEKLEVNWINLSFMNKMQTFWLPATTTWTGPGKHKMKISVFYFVSIK